MGTKLMTRMGDGTAVEMTRDELRADIEDGVAAAVKRAKVPPLDDDEAAHLLDIFASQERMTGVRPATRSSCRATDPPPCAPRGSTA